MLNPNIKIHKAYKKYGDAWGELYRYGFRGRLRKFKILDVLGKRPQYNNRYFQFTFYVGGFGFIRRRKTKYGQAFVQKQHIKFLYGSAQEKVFRKKWKKAKNLRNINAIIPSFFNILESSLFMILLRSNLAVNFIDAAALVSTSAITINNSLKINASPYHRVSNFSTVRILFPTVFERAYRFLLKKRFYKFLPPVSYLDVDYKTFSIYYRGVDNRNLPYFTFKFNFNKLFNVYYV
jgi:ribosomal protein S4